MVDRLFGGKRIRTDARPSRLRAFFVLLTFPLLEQKMHNTHATTMKRKTRHLGTDTHSRAQHSFLVAATALWMLLSAPATAFQTKRRNPPGFARRTSTGVYRVFSTTRLSYQDSAGDDTVTQRGWWNPFPLAHQKPSKKKSDSVDQKQAVVDDYLEFLDRRYHRLHEEEEEPHAKFSAWKWLTQGSDDDNDDSVEPVKQPKTDDALYVLGVAGLASQKLLQKRHLPVPQAEQDRPEAAVDVPPSKVLDATVVTPSLASKILGLFQLIPLQRKKLLQYQSKKLHAIPRALLKTVRAGPGKAIRKVLDLGGGTRTVAITTTAVAAVLFFVVAPLAKAIVSEGAQHA